MEAEAEVALAALMIYSFTYLEVDQKTAQDMERIRNEAISDSIIRHRPWLPPVPSVTPYIGKCSKPINKQLEDSDVKNTQARLSLKKDLVVKEFLPVLKTSAENVKDGMEVIAYDSNGNIYDRMKFILWAKKMYVLTRQWRQFCEDHKLVSNNDGVSVWMFRDNQTDELCVVIAPILDPSLSPAERDFRRMSLNEKPSYHLT